MQLQAITVEYFIQNETTDFIKQEVGAVNPNLVGNFAPQYPNMYILPKKYASAKDVNIADVIRSFPL